MIKIKYNSPNYIISGINVNTFYNDILKTFKTSKINKIYKSSFGLFGKKLIVHEFFLPELMFCLLSIPKRVKYISLTNQLYEST
jgi:hypothetical protein